jgi:hypothetical protein
VWIGKQYAQVRQNIELQQKGTEPIDFYKDFILFESAKSYVGFRIMCIQYKCLSWRQAYTEQKNPSVRIGGVFFVSFMENYFFGAGRFFQASAGG